MKQSISILFLCLGVSSVRAQFYQQSPKFVPGGLVQSSYSGTSVDVSADFSTLITGATGVVGAAGAAVICNRSGSNWAQSQVLIGSGATFGANQGCSVAISDDGNTAIVGGPSDDVDAGAAWVFVRSGGYWSQQGAKLIGTGATGKAFQGYAVAISGDGNTVMVGGPNDNSNLGAAWVFTRSGGSWIQQGTKLVGSGGGATENQGFSVALSYDGSTALVGAPGGRNPGGYGVGAVYMYKRTGGSWIQEGHMWWLSGVASFGASVALSADGNTGIVGAPRAESVGVLVRSGGVWSAQADFSGSLPVGSQRQGESVAISADGNRAVIGGGSFHIAGGTAGAGAAWFFKRSGSTWSQEGAKFIGTGASGNSLQGASVAISSDGRSFAVGGPGDNSYRGAVWLYSEVIPATTTPPYTNVQAIVNDVRVKIYPNPASSLINVVFDQPLIGQSRMLFTDALGKVVVAHDIEGGSKEYTEDIAVLSPGVYVLNIQNGENTQYKAVIVKE
jgi:hypothetical protein